MKYYKCTNLMKNGLGEMKPYYCKGDYIWSDGNGNITSKSRQEFKHIDGDAYHYDRWIKEIKKYVEKTNEGFEYNDVLMMCKKHKQFMKSIRRYDDE